MTVAWGLFTGVIEVAGIECVFLCRDPDEPVVRISFGMLIDYLFV